MISVVELKRTCFACPSQWEGKTDDDRPVYVRFRWGCLAVEVGKPGQGIDDAILTGDRIFCEEIGDAFDGFMTFESLKEATQKVASWPANHDDDPQPNLYMISFPPLTDDKSPQTFEAMLVQDLDGSVRYFDILTMPNTGVGPLEFLDMGAYELNCSDIPGDNNCDGVVDFKDVAILAGNWLTGK